jgi:hypothetical protein
MPALRYAKLYPDKYYWWDEELKEKVGGPNYTYPRFPLGAITDVISIGQRVLAESHIKIPRGKVIFVTNEEDTAVNLEMIQFLKSQWKRRGADVSEYSFPKGVVKTHDIIDPNQDEQNTQAVYPELLKLITK